MVVTVRELVSKLSACTPDMQVVIDDADTDWLLADIQLVVRDGRVVLYGTYAGEVRE